MSWYLLRKTWVAKVKVDDGQYKTLWSGVKASRKDIKWDREMKSVKIKAEQAVNKRIALEGLEVPNNQREFTFDDVCALYKEHFNYDKYRMEVIEQEFEGRVMDEISPLDIRRLKKKILETCKPTTWNRCRNILNAIFNRGIEWEMCTKNPVKAVKGVADEKVTKFLTAIEADALLIEARKIGFYIYAFIFFALKTGRRVGEILKVEWADVDFEKGEIRFHVSKKIGGWKTVYRKPPESVFRMLLLLQRTNVDKPFPYFPRREWRRVRDKVDGELKLPDRRFHALRHRCATEMIENGATLYDVQHYLCHSNPSTTMIYAHISEKRDEKIRSFLE